jgi:hypothetical protein
MFLFYIYISGFLVASLTRPFTLLIETVHKVLNAYRGSHAIKMSQVKSWGLVS